MSTRRPSPGVRKKLSQAKKVASRCNTYKQLASLSGLSETTLRHYQIAPRKSSSNSVTAPTPNVRLTGGQFVGYAPRRTLTSDESYIEQLRELGLDEIGSADIKHVSQFGEQARFGLVLEYQKDYVPDAPPDPSFVRASIKIAQTEQELLDVLTGSDRGGDNAISQLTKMAVAEVEKHHKTPNQPALEKTAQQAQALKCLRLANLLRWCGEEQGKP